MYWFDVWKALMHITRWALCSLHPFPEKNDKNGHKKNELTNETNIILSKSSFLSSFYLEFGISYIYLAHFKIRDANTVISFFFNIQSLSY